MTKLMCGLIAAAFALAALFAWYLEQERQVALADAAMATKIDAALAAALSDDVEFQTRFGKFVRLDGAGFDRPKYFGQLIERLEMKRTAVFERGSVQLSVMAPCGESPDLAMRKATITAWSPKHDAGPAAAAGRSYEVGVRIGEARPEDADLTCAAFSPDCALVGLGYVNRLEIWDRETQRRLREIRGHVGPVDAIEFSAAGDRLVASCRNGTVQVWDVAGGGFVHSTWTGGIERSQPADLSSDGSLVIAAAEWTPPQTTPQTPPPTHQRATVTRIADGRVTSLSQSGPYPGWCLGVALADDGRFAATIDRDRAAVQLWDVAGATSITTLSAGGAIPASTAPHSLRFSPDGGRLIAVPPFVSSSYRPVVWQIPSGKIAATLSIPSRARLSNNTTPPALSHDGSRLAIGALSEGQVVIWNLADGRPLGIVENSLWQPAGTLSNPRNVTWETAEGRFRYRTASGSLTKRPALGLAAIGFDDSGNLHGVSTMDDAVWLWTSDLGKPLLDPYVAPKRTPDRSK